MTTVTFHSADRRFDGFTVEGHSGYAEEGSDIVCAAISGVVGMVECTVNDVLGLAAAVKVEDGYMSLKLPGGLGQANERTCQDLLTGMMVYLQALSEEYPENLIVRLEDDDDDDEEE